MLDTHDIPQMDIPGEIDLKSEQGIRVEQFVESGAAPDLFPNSRASLPIFTVAERSNYAIPSFFVCPIVRAISRFFVGQK